MVWGIEDMVRIIVGSNRNVACRDGLELATYILTAKNSIKSIYTK